MRNDNKIHVSLRNMEKDEVKDKRRIKVKG